jgi:hypothetical protein
LNGGKGKNLVNQLCRTLFGIKPIFGGHLSKFSELKLSYPSPGKEAHGLGVDHSKNKHPFDQRNISNLFG